MTPDTENARRPIPPAAPVGSTRARGSAARRILFLQCTNAGQYPPICHAATLLADADWVVEVLSSPSRDTADLEFPQHAGVRHRKMPVRATNAVRPSDFAAYTAVACAAAVRHRTTVIYASDPLAAMPALAAAQLSGAAIVYHEHDAPGTHGLRPLLASCRMRLASRAAFVLIPNEQRAILLGEELGVPPERRRVVWNMPRRCELPPLISPPARPLRAYYHGSITPERLPLSVVEGVRRLEGRVRLRVGGYEAAGAQGYVETLVSAGEGHVEYVGVAPAREDLLRGASDAHVGLALMPAKTNDVNMRHMVGASNKAFDYMAAGLPLLVSDLPDWRAAFVVPGYGRGCDPMDPASVAAALDWYLENEVERGRIAARCRAKIEADWNYDTAFEPIARELAEL